MKRLISSRVVDYSHINLCSRSSLRRQLDRSRQGHRIHPISASSLPVTSPSGDHRHSNALFSSGRSAKMKQDLAHDPEPGLSPSCNGFQGRGLVVRCIQKLRWWILSWSLALASRLVPTFRFDHPFKPSTPPVAPRYRAAAHELRMFGA